MTALRHGEPPIDQPYPGAPFGAAFRRFWKKGFTFTGRASRSEYWKAYLATIGVFAALYIVAAIVLAVSYSSGAFAFGQFVFVLALLYGLATLIPSLAAVVRRLHDANQSGAMYFVCLIPFVGGIILLVMLAQDSNPHGARFDLARLGALPDVEGSRIAPPPGLPPAYAQDAALPPVPPPPAPAVSALPPMPAPVQAAASVPPPPAPAPVALLVPPPPPPAPAAAPAPAVPPPPAVPAAAPAVPPVPAPTVVPSSWLPAPAAPEPAVALVADPEPEPEIDLDETRISVPAAAGGWVVELPDGRRLPVEGSLFFGRDPIADPGTSGAVLVPVDDPRKSMSKTHARIDAVGGGLSVTDLHSTNGTTVTEADGPRVVLTPGSARAVESAADISFGDYVVTLRRG